MIMKSSTSYISWISEFGKTLKTFYQYSAYSLKLSHIIVITLSSSSRGWSTMIQFIHLTWGSSGSSLRFCLLGWYRCWYKKKPLPLYFKYSSPNCSITFKRLVTENTCHLSVCRDLYLSIPWVQCGCRC